MTKALNRCAIYTRKSNEEGLEQDFNSLDAQREACAAYVTSQASLGWKLLPRRYDDGGISGGHMDRPALQELLHDIEAGRIDTVVVYKIDRLTRSLSDFSKMVEIFDKHQVSFVSVTQQFNTTTSMGRLTLNVMLLKPELDKSLMRSGPQVPFDVTCTGILQSFKYCTKSGRLGLSVGSPNPVKSILSNNDL